MFDSQKFNKIRENHSVGGVVFVFYDRFSKKFGPLNVANSIDDVVFTACNHIKSVEDKNISLSHIDVYVAGSASPEDFIYDLHEPILFFNASDYKEAYNFVLQEVTYE